MEDDLNSREPRLGDTEQTCPWLVVFDSATLTDQNCAAKHVFEPCAGSHLTDLHSSPKFQNSDLAGGMESIWNLYEDPTVFHSLV